MLQVVCSVIAAFTSFVVAYLTVRNQRKKDAVDRRFEVYKSLLSFLFQLKNEPIRLTDYQSLKRLRDQEVAIKVCGSSNLISLVSALIADYDSSFERYQKDCGRWDNQVQGERDLAEEGKCEPISPAQLQNEEDEYYKWALQRLIDGSSLGAHIEKLSKEMRRSLGYREFRPAVWLRQTKLYSHLNIWSY